MQRSPAIPYLVADDFGLCPEINRAVAVLHDQRVLNRVSWIVNTGYFQESARFLSEHPRLLAGVHLNLTDGRPVLPPSAVPSLVNLKGEFIGGRHYAVLARIVLNIFKVQEIKAEWRAQIQKAKEAGVGIYHLNSHGHLHLLPKLHGAYLDLVEEFRIPYARLVLSGQSMKAVILKAFSTALLKAAANRNLRFGYPARILGIDHAGHVDKALIRRELSSGHHQGTTEFVIHPSIGQNQYHERWKYPPNLELDAFLDPQIVEHFKSLEA